MKNDPLYEQRTDRWLIRLMNRRDSLKRLAFLVVLLALVGVIVGVMIA